MTRTGLRLRLWLGSNWTQFPLAVEGLHPLKPLTAEAVRARLLEDNALASFDLLHELTPDLPGPERMELFESLPDEIQQAMHANLATKLEGERLAR